MRDYLRRLREEKNLTQQDMAEEMGVKSNYYCMIENGNRQEDIKLSAVMAFAKKFGVTAEKIIELELEWLKSKAEA